MSAPRFVPLACPHCGSDLTGSARDVVCFCAGCRSAWRIDRGLPDRVESLFLPAPAPEAPLLSLPFWRTGRFLLPAFATPRPITLARIASAAPPEGAGLLPGLPDQIPAGVFFPPEAAARLLPLLTDTPEAPPPDALVALPLLPGGRAHRFHLAGHRAPLYDEDLGELAPATP